MIPKSIAALFSRPGFIGLLTTILLATIGFNTTYLSYKVSEESDRNELLGLLGIMESNLEQYLSHCKSAALMMAYTINDQGEPQEFDSVAMQLLSDDRFDIIELLPKGVIEYVHPLKGNESVLGYNILEDPNRNLEALKAKELKQMYFAGPIPLRQGGNAIIGRLPVYIKNEFWGFSAVVVNTEKFLNSLGIAELNKNELLVQLSKVNPNTQQEEFFLPAIEGFPHETSKKVSIKEGDWNIYIGYKNNVKAIFAVVPMAVLSLLLALIGGFFVMEILKKPSELEAQLEKHHVDLQLSERKYRSFFENAAIGVAHVNPSTGEFLSVNDKLCEILGYSASEMKLFTFNQLTHPDDLEISIEKQHAILNGLIRDFSIEKRYIGKNGQQVYANVNVSPLWKVGEDPTTVVVLVEDISSKKDLEQKVLEGSIQAQEIQKNRIALEIHDGIVQELVASAIHAESLEKLKNNPYELSHRITALVALIKKITNDARDVSHNLLSADVSTMKMSELFSRLEQQLKSLTSIDIRMEVHILNEDDISDEIKTNIFRVIQELTTNIIKHSKATFASITLEEIGDDLYVNVRDNGVGMNGQTTIGIGTYTVRNRISKIGGTLQYNHPDSGGLEVTFSVPLV